MRAVALPAPADEALFSRHNVQFGGQGAIPIVFAHGYGCDQSMWRLTMPAFHDAFRTAAFDYVGCGGSTVAYDPDKFGQLEGYADDVLDICRAVGDGAPVIFVGHSVSAMIGAIAAAREPELFLRLVMIGPSPFYLSDGDYTGGFTQDDIEALLSLMDADDRGWAAAMAPTIMGNPERPELAAELEASFCRMDPPIARRFARVTFLSDNRDELGRIPVPTLVLQCSEDAIAPTHVGAYVHSRLPNSHFVQLNATGHCPHLSAPEETVEKIRGFLADLTRPERD